jgi:hypothetical protein
MEKRYPALRIIGTSYKTLGVLILVSTILSVFVLLRYSLLYRQFYEQYDNIIYYLIVVVPVVVTVIIGSALAVSCYAIGELVYVFLDLEENTRATNKLLRQQVDSSSS